MKRFDNYPKHDIVGNMFNLVLVTSPILGVGLTLIALVYEGPFNRNWKPLKRGTLLILASPIAVPAGICMIPYTIYKNIR